MIDIFFPFFCNCIDCHLFSSAARWFKDMKEVATSILSPGCMDLPIDAGIWLKQFNSQNSKLLSQLDVRACQDVTLPYLTCARFAA